MRFIFYTLLVANFALAGWWTLEGPAAPQKSVLRVEEVALVDVEPLMLLDEVTVSRGELRQTPSPLLEAAPRSCRMVGPVTSPDAAAHLAAQLAAFGFSADVQPIQQIIGHAHWVYLPAEESSQNADQRQSVLQARGIDSFIVTEGGLAGHIAVGVYSSEDAAADRLEEMRRRGLAPEVTILAQTQTEFWIMVVPGPSQLVTGSDWRSALSADIPLQEKEIFCLDVASR